MTKRYLVLFTVGPVQSFISSARKIEDFWSGSYLLSHLIREALRNLYKNAPTFQLVFPVLSREEIDNPNHDTLHIASLPNRFTAIIEGDMNKVIEHLQETEKEIKEAFLDVCGFAIKTLFASLPDEKRSYLLKATEEQIDALLEMYWVIEPFADEDNFKLVREKLESRLGALKNDKQYPQVEQLGLTCSVCHERDALCAKHISEKDRYGDMKRKLARTWDKRDRRFKGEKVQRIRDNEFLCGICTGKRLARDYFKFFYNFSKGFRGFNSVTELTSANQSYYAILMMDGDNMGSLFSGERMESYSEVSKKLATFAMDAVPKIVEKEVRAQLVYAGGDDVLAFMPVQDALKIANDLRFAFSSEEEGLGKGATASAGLVIGHEKAPLQGLLNEVRNLEKKAKSYRKGQTVKNALAIGVHTRAGEISETVLPWTIGDTRTIEQLERIISLLKEELSSTFVYTFMEAFAPLLHPTVKDYEKIASREMVEVELRRLLKRSVKGRLNNETVEEAVQYLVTLHDCSPTTMDFLHLLKILTFFERKEE
ncbi:type III-B CRISPR-associated protein Cas10/Cmr2 [Bacillus sp. DTU_2020_1000418_1_SI_GHA_SEK_038]|uniref:type III-B CRISPR-associated protein Cas10/Cmr2 n=1 Tax=Bacillus sp. DTU_2020_1000418_1_SI_GHA_SEK_038 TaxID=3077585 RepID=UPI0028EB5289|nr:type III-B CRISPR-associated protein Cas10/Cmr2 [Bacillus sp. DTU_2020_1000418_1_SI_GHA_SEK_038]WNS77429.1 type III-B CRISPR-associated protein Cas10/Cmr2 [Bacillus sp. DTU_2020_1000418_1_SI_GHA_SEK_038]